jgi:hypothetical protein
MTIEALSKYRRSHPSDRPFVDRAGEHERVETYVVPDAKLADAQEHFACSRENILPDHRKDDVYAPCVQAAVAVPSQEWPNHHEVTVIFRRPSPAMILQPGRAILSLETYTTTIKREYGSFRNMGSRDGVLIRPMGSLIQVDQGLEVIERLALVVQAADWAVNLNIVAARAEQWTSKGGELTIYGRLWENLKCSRVRVEPRSTNAGILDSTWTFVQNNDGWPREGVIAETYIAFDSEGNQLYYDPKKKVFPHVKPGLTWEGRKLIVATSDVISGDADFSALETYFTWMMTGG